MICELWPFVYIMSKLSYVIHRFCLSTWWSRMIQGKTYPVIDTPVHGKHNGASYNSVWHSIHKLHLFLWVPVIYFTDACCTNWSFLLLPLCRVIAPKVISISGGIVARAYIWHDTLILNKLEFEKCTIVFQIWSHTQTHKN